MSDKYYLTTTGDNPKVVSPYRYVTSEAPPEDVSHKGFAWRIYDPVPPPNVGPTERVKEGPLTIFQGGVTPTWIVMEIPAEEIARAQAQARLLEIRESLPDRPSTSSLPDISEAIKILVDTLYSP